MIETAYYYPNKMSSSEEASLRCAILVGAALGQLSFGFLADLYGRRTMYGWELSMLFLQKKMLPSIGKCCCCTIGARTDSEKVIMIGAILGLATASSGAEHSMSIFGWLFFWRLVMGIGSYSLETFWNLGTILKHS